MLRNDQVVLGVGKRMQLRPQLGKAQQEGEQQRQRTMPHFATGLASVRR